MRRSAAALVAAAFVISGCGDDSSSPPAAQGPGLHSFACPDPKANVAPTPGDTLPTGATAALVCFWDADVAWTAPTGPLTSHVDRIVALVNSRRADRNPTGVCNLSGGPAWSMVFRYADGVRTIDGDNGGCKTMQVGSTVRDGAPRVFAGFLDALGTQRVAADPPDIEVPKPACPTAGGGFVFPSWVAQPGRAVVAIWCARQGHRWVESGPLTDAELRGLRHQLTSPLDELSNPGRIRECHGLPRTAYGLIAGRDPWGEPFTIDLFCDVFHYDPPGASGGIYAHMSPETRSLVAMRLGDSTLQP